MPWFRRSRRSQAAPPRTDGPHMAVDERAVGEYLAAWAAARRGVEAYVEPSTPVTATTVVLVAFDGEWTRRAVADREAAFRLGKRLDLPTYDVNLTGYPPRMREWTARRRRELGGRG